MRKEVLSLRLEPEIIKWVNSKTTKSKNKSEVVQELLHMAMQKEKLGFESEHTSLQARATKASILTMVMLELFLKQTHEKGNDIVKKAFDIYQKGLESTPAEIEIV
jgi:hypothetical protein